ncbi:hypothetical protein F5882DRAFT_469944 [Hyaloscypha sp. PMI_1271]|nr:hypothetical protein F5882DRAFT_469944 [Hyaloscypha sp. PMI_1271]
MQTPTSFITFIFFTFLTLATAKNFTHNRTATIPEMVSAVKLSAIAEIALMAKSSPSDTNGTSTCQCLQPGIWCGTRSGNGTLNDIVRGRLNGTQHGDHNAARPETRQQTLNGTCDWDTVYLRPLEAGPAQNSLPCREDAHAVKKHCWELERSWIDICD